VLHMVTDWNNTQSVIYARINFLHQYTDKFGILIPNLFVFLPKLQKIVPNLWVPEIQKNSPQLLCIGIKQIHLRWIS